MNRISIEVEELGQVYLSQPDGRTMLETVLPSDEGYFDAPRAVVDHASTVPVIEQVRRAMPKLPEDTQGFIASLLNNSFAWLTTVAEDPRPLDIDLH